jgi:hypothetical protein
MGAVAVRLWRPNNKYSIFGYAVVNRTHCCDAPQ